MSGRSEIISALRKCIVDTDKLVVIYSSLAHFKVPPGVNKWDFLSCISKLASEGKTLAFPTFTFSFCRNGHYDYRSSPSETGILGQWVLLLNEAIRTPHPIYSFAVIGPMSQELAAASNSTTFGNDSIFSCFERNNARIIMFGCGWDFCTQFHRYEEEAEVPYRKFEWFKGNVNYGSGESLNKVKMYVRDLALNPINIWDEVALNLRKKDSVLSTILWNGEIESASCDDISRTCRAILSENKWGLVADNIEKEYYYSQLKKAESEAPIRIAILCSSNLALINNHFVKSMAKFVLDRRAEFYMVPFGQILQEIFNPNSALNEFDAQFTFFPDRVEDLTGSSLMDSIDPEAAKSKLIEYVKAIKHYRANRSGWIVVNRFARLTAPLFREADETHPSGNRIIIDNFNKTLEQELNGLKQLHLYDTALSALTYKQGGVCDPRLWTLGRFPFSDGFSEYLAKKYTQIILAVTGRTARMVVVDLDNTLWGGVLGEDGPAGLKLGGDYPGNAFSAFQKVLKKLAERGIVLAISSKNDENHAMETIKKLPAMILQPQDFVCNRINWKPKWQNIAEIAREVNIGIENVLFVDDNPVERQLMRLNLPAIKILELPEDPAYYSQALIECPWLECIQLTKEDLKRAKSYTTQVALKSRLSTHSSPEEFYATLNIKLHFSQLEEGNLNRAVQLINKTNQFNATTRRYDQCALDKLMSDGSDVIVVGAEDKFSEFENIGVIILRWNYPSTNQVTIDSYLLSCRILGKGIETGVIKWAACLSQKRGYKDMIGEIIETERNTPVRSVYKDAGFEQGNMTGFWYLNLQKQIISTPQWLDIIDHIS